MFVEDQSGDQIMKGKFYFLKSYLLSVNLSERVFKRQLCMSYVSLCES